MSRNVLIVALMAIIGLLVLAAVNPPRAEAQSGRDGGQWRVVAGDGTFVLYNTADTDGSWLLIPNAQPAKKDCVWMPIKLLKSESDLRTWRALEDARR